MLPASFSKAVHILEHLENHGHHAYFVGGCVRDVLLGRKLGDIDIATSAKPGQVQDLFEKVIPVGIEHGTVIVRYGRESYEVTTFRVEDGYSDNRHPDHVSFIDRIDLDLARRDFTINALAMDKTGKIIDLFGGKKDLQQKKIRAVGNGMERFREDALRIVRALRFSSQLGFSIDPDTMEAILACKALIGNVAIERITNELKKFFSGEFIQNGLCTLRETDIHRHLPIFDRHKTLLDKLPDNMEPLNDFDEVIAMFHYLEPGISITDWVRAWKCSNQIKQQAENLSASLTYYREYGLDNWFVYKADKALHEKLLHLIKLLFREKPLDITDFQRIYKGIPIHSRYDLKINGSDLIALFPDKNQGPWIKQLLEKMEKAVVIGRIKNDKSSLKEWAICNLPEIN